MKKEFRVLLFLISVLFAFCKEPFDPNLATKTAPSDLVVEGFINAAGTTNISLTRTLPLAQKTVSAKGELKAKVQVEGETSGVFPLTEAGSGVYTVAQLNLDPAQKYRLRIKTSGGTEYLSDFVPVKTTPLIDSVNWARTNDGVQIYVNTHDTKNETRYYQWDYDETWEYHSKYPSQFKIGNDVSGRFPPHTIVARDDAEISQLYYCWRSQKSTTLSIASTAKLSDDVVYLSPLQFIPNGSEQLTVRYSILVRQHALSREAFEYLSLMKKNSEQVGSLFDTQPTEIKGNIHNTSDPNEIVIGYVAIASAVEKRIFINNAQLPNWTFVPLGCSDVISTLNPDSLNRYIIIPNNYMTYVDEGSVILVHGTSEICEKCVLKGGTNVKPSFW